jgi:hypothetical protein
VDDGATDGDAAADGATDGDEPTEGGGDSDADGKTAADGETEAAGETPFEAPDDGAAVPAADADADGGVVMSGPEGRPEQPAATRLSVANAATIDAARF